MNYYICWKSAITGHEGRGTKAFSRQWVTTWIRKFLEEGNNLIYWIESEDGKFISRTTETMPDIAHLDNVLNFSRGHR